MHLQIKYKLLNLIIFVTFSLTLLNCAAVIKLHPPFKGSATDWSTYGGNNNRTNRSMFTLELPIELAWKYSGNGGISPQSPIISKGIMFIGFLNGELHALDIKTGERIGNLNLESAVEGCPVIGNYTLYIPTAHGENSLKAYDLLDGKYKWKKKILDIESSLILIDDNIFCTTVSGSVVCVNKNTGNSVWEYITPKGIHSSPASDLNRIYTGCDDGYLYALNLKDGKFLWKYYTGGAIFSTPLIYNGKILFGSDDKNFYCLDINTRLPKWQYNTNAPIKSGSAVSDSIVYFGSLDGYLYALNINTGSIIWTFKTKSIINTSPMVTGNYLLLSSMDKMFYILDKFTGEKVWEYETEGRIKTSPIFWNGYLILCFEDYYIYAFKTKEEK